MTKRTVYTHIVGGLVCICGATARAQTFEEFMADVDGNNTADIIRRDDSGNWNVYYFNGMAFGPAMLFKNSYGHLSDYAFVQDIDADGKADAVTMTPSTGTWRAAKSTGTNMFGTTKKFIDVFGGGASGVALMGDVNGDGRSDAVWFDRPAATWQVALSNGSKFQTPTTFLTGWGFGAGQPYVADVTGDGKADAIWYDSDHTQLWVSKSTGSAFTAGPTWVSYYVPQASWVPQFADANGDGRKDLVFLDGETRDLYVGHAITRNFLKGGYLYHAMPGAGKLLMGDVDGDGKIDAVSDFNVVPNSVLAPQLCSGGGLNGHLQYFGFFNVVRTGMPNGVLTVYNDYSMEGALSNISHMREFKGNDYALEATMFPLLHNTVHDHNKWVVSLQNYLFYEVPGTNGHFLLHSDYESRLDTLSAQFTPVMRDAILAFEIIDEPFSDIPGGENVDEADFLAAVDAVHDRFPMFPVWGTLLFCDVRKFTPGNFPFELDFVGFHSYGAMLRGAWNYEIVDTLNYLKSLTPNPIILTVEAYGEFFQANGRFCPTDGNYINGWSKATVASKLSDILYAAYALAAADDQTVGLFLYQWPDDLRCNWPGYDYTAWGATHFFLEYFGPLLDVYSQVDYGIGVAPGCQP